MGQFIINLYRHRWPHLEIAAAMLLSVNVAGLSFAGADAGGFFGDADSELMTRWIQAASYTPFFRGHAHHDSKRREPWVYGEPTTTRIRHAIAQRYALLPYWYTVFADARFKGLPVMRPLFAHFPEDSGCLTLDDEWLIGSDLLIRPVTSPGQKDASVYFPGQGVWYDVAEPADSMNTKQPLVFQAGRFNVAAPLDTIPVFQRGGSIVPRQRRLRRSSQTMLQDPYELTVAIDGGGNANGQVYIDDGKSDKFLDGLFVQRNLQYADGLLSCSAAIHAGLPFGVPEPSGFSPENIVERVVVLGLVRPHIVETPFVGNGAQIGRAHHGRRIHARRFRVYPRGAHAPQPKSPNRPRLGYPTRLLNKSKATSRRAPSRAQGDSGQSALCPH